MKTVSNEYKETAKSLARTPLAKFICEGVTYDGENLSEGVLTEQSYVDDILFGNTTIKNLEITLKDDNNTDFLDKEIEFYTGLNVNGTSEYVRHGTFIVDSMEIDESSKKIKMTALDLMVKTNTPFVDSFPWAVDAETGEAEDTHTLLEFADMVVAQCGLALVTRDFPNATFEIKVKPAFEGYQCRYVLGKIAEIAGCNVYINSEDQVEIRFKNDVNEEIVVDSIVEMKTENVIVTPYNAVVLALADGVEGENVTFRDESSIEQYGQRSLIITANEFAIDQATRELLIEPIFNAVNGFNYIPMELTYNAYDYLDRMDKIRVFYGYESDEYYETYLLNHTIQFPSSMKSKIENNSASPVNVENEYVPETVQKQNHTEIVVDKANAKISAMVKTANEQGSQLAQIELTNQSIESRVTATETNYNDLKEGIESIQTTILEQTKSEFNMWFEQTGLKKTVEDLEKELNTNTATLETWKDYIKFEAGQITIGSTNNQTKLVIAKERISFYDGANNECAYISQNALYITDSTILNKLQIGHWEQKEDNDFNLNTKWVGGI